MPKTFDPDRFADELEAILERHVAGITDPEARFVAADAACTAVVAFGERARAVRGNATNALRDAGFSWPAIGDLVDVSRQRAEQFAQAADTTN